MYMTYHIHDMMYDVIYDIFTTYRIILIYVSLNIYIYIYIYIYMYTRISIYNRGPISSVQGSKTTNPPGGFQRKK